MALLQRGKMTPRLHRFADLVTAAPSMQKVSAAISISAHMTTAASGMRLGSAEISIGANLEKIAASGSIVRTGTLTGLELVSALLHIPNLQLNL